MVENDIKEAQEPTTEQQFAVLERKFRSLTQEVHIPFLDCKFYEKYLLSDRTSKQRLLQLCLLTKHLVAHKQATRAVLVLIGRREAVVVCLFGLLQSFQRGQLAAVETQGRVLQILQSHRKITLELIQAIQQWREGLTRPFPFMYRGVNYLIKIMADCYRLAACHVSSTPVLPVSLVEQPLCSGVPSLTPEGLEAQLRGYVSYPLQSSRKAFVKEAPVPVQQKYKRAETYIKNERALQQDTVTELLDMCSRGLFLPILKTQGTTFAQAGKVGIAVKSEEWMQRWQRSLEDMQDCLAISPEEIAGRCSPLDGHGSDSEGEEEEEYEDEEEEDDEDVSQDAGLGPTVHSQPLHNMLRPASV